MPASASTLSPRSAPRCTARPNGFHLDPDARLPRSHRRSRRSCSITPAESPGGGYLPLSLFGLAPIAGMGDETIANFNVPAFKYGSETYTRVGCRVQRLRRHRRRHRSGRRLHRPADPVGDPAENIVAPFWDTSTRLRAVRSGSTAHNLDGVDTWLVIDYTDVVHSVRRSRTRSRPGSSWVARRTSTIANGVVDTTTPDGTLLGQGAENRDGTSGAAHVVLAPIRQPDRQHCSPHTWWQRHGDNDLRRAPVQSPVPTCCCRPRQHRWSRARSARDRR